jgi:hypothetical protein
MAKAREKISSDPEDAVSNMRRIMDQALAEIAERLEVTMPYLRGDENDRRTAGQFVPQIIARAKKKFKIKDGSGNYEPNNTAVAALEAVQPQLATLANAATHTFSSSKTEAESIIDHCERALAAFDCDDCEKPVWYLEDTDRGNHRCDCGKLRWKE